MSGARVTIAATMRQIIDSEDGVSAAGIAAHCGVSKSTVYRWRDGADPGAANLIRLLHHPDPRVSHPVAALVIGGSAFGVVDRGPRDLDADGDGRVTVADALHFVLLVGQDSTSLAPPMLEAIQAGRCSDDVVARLEASTMRIIDGAHSVLDALRGSRQPHYKNRPNTEPPIEGRRR